MASSVIAALDAVLTSTYSGPRASASQPRHTADVETANKKVVLYRLSDAVRFGWAVYAAYIAPELQQAHFGNSVSDSPTLVSAVPRLSTRHRL